MDHRPQDEGNSEDRDENECEHKEGLSAAQDQMLEAHSRNCTSLPLVAAVRNGTRTVTFIERERQLDAKASPDTPSARMRLRFARESDHTRWRCELADDSEFGIAADHSNVL